MIDNVLFLSRFSNGNVNSKPDTYTIWDSYRYGLEAHIENIICEDYYDIYFEKGKKGFEDYIENLINTHKIKFLFIGFAAEDFTFDISFLYKIKKKYQICMIHTSQDPETFFESRDRYYNQFADYILPFTAIRNNCIYKLYGIEAITLYSLYNKNVFEERKLKKTIDVSFIGNINKANRREYISYLQNHGINVEVYGPGSKNGFVSHDKMIDIFNTSKINLNFTDSALCTYFDFNTNTNFTIGTHINSRIQQAKGRLIEISLTNSFVLSQDGDGTRKLFDDDRIIFKTKEELLDKIWFYLKNFEQRDMVALSLHKKALEQYEAKNRFEKLLPMLKHKSKSIEKVYVDSQFYKDYSSYHFLFVFNFLFKKRFSLVYQELKLILKYRKFDFKTIFYHLKMQSIYAYKRYRKMKK